MLTVTTRAHLAPLEIFGRALRQYADTAAERAANDSVARIRGGAYWTNRTGKTGRSFRRKRMGPAWHQVYSTSDVAKMLDTGTRPHDIVAKNAKALRFVQNGSVRFASRVHHPGTKRLGYEAVEQVLGAVELAEAAEDALQKAAALAG